MKLAVISHKQCWRSPDSPTQWASDGGFAIQMDYLSSLFDETIILTPEISRKKQGEVYFSNKTISIYPLSKAKGKGLSRKLLLPLWFIKNFTKFHKVLRKVDAIHAPIPGDIGTIAILLAHIYRKPLYVRHCGNWFKQRTTAEKLWKWYLEKFAGKKRVFLATGGDIDKPSKNKNIDWIFSTSLSIKEFVNFNKSQTDIGNTLKICSVSRQEKGKGTHKVIQAVKLLVDKGINVHYDIVGNGTYLDTLKKLSSNLKLTENITFHGNLNHEEVISVLKKNDIFVFPTESEGFPKVIVEAMSQGLAIITTPVSILKDMIPESKSGILLDRADEKDIFKQLTFLLDNPDKIIEMGKNGNEYAKKYTLEKWANTIAEKLEKAWNVQLNKFEI